MRRLGAELGVAAMSIYEYFSSKEEILDALVDAAAAEITLPEVDGQWRVQISALTLELMRALERHPSGILIRFTRPILSRQAMLVTERGMAILAHGGFSRADAARAYRTIFLYAFAYASFSGDATGERGERMGAEAAIKSLPETDYPAVRVAASELAATMAGEDQFRWGLDRLLDGLEALRCE
ncbi:hypothetical protein BH24ACT23_BH24ACT23_08090 [soil metagenome]